MKRGCIKIHTAVGIALVLSAFACTGPEVPPTVEVPAGSFMMGSAAPEAERDESPVHMVVISHPFRMGVTEVTNAQYECFDPSHKTLRGKDGVSAEDDDAVVNVSWHDAAAYCTWLSKKEGRAYRLPTEAEWEWACRAGTATAYFTGDTLPASMCRNQVVTRDYAPVSLKVGQTEPNAFGLMDMHGNVEEWCLDWYGPYTADGACREGFWTSDPTEGTCPEGVPGTALTDTGAVGAGQDGCDKKGLENPAGPEMEKGGYDKKGQTDPAGPAEGEFRVTRGGSHNTPVKYLRSSNRMAMIPEDRSSLTGFRVVQSDYLFPTPASRVDTPLPTPTAKSDTPLPIPAAVSGISLPQSEADNNRPKPEINNNSLQPEINNNRPQQKINNENSTARLSDTAVFFPPIPFVKEPSDGSTPFYSHNHQPSVVACDNGDLLAAWFSTDEENGREMVVLSSWLKAGEDEWEEPALFFKVPDRNMTGTSLFNDGHGTLCHINGVEAAGDWQNLIMVMRTSTDNGLTWTAPRIIAPEHAKRHQVVAGTLQLKDGTLIQACDAGAGGNDGTAVHISTDGGRTWTDPWDGSPAPWQTDAGTWRAGGRRGLKDGETGTTIAGIHAGIVELSDGSLMALGRGIGSSVIEDSTGKKRMPMSISKDMGATWEYHASEFPPIDGGQRLVLMRLREGSLLLVSFTDHPDRTPKAERGMEFRKAGGRDYGRESHIEPDPDRQTRENRDKRRPNTGREKDGGQKFGDGKAGGQKVGDGDAYVGYGMFAAVSYDDGRTWPVKRLLTDGVERELDGGGWTGTFTMDATHAEPKGYLTGAQTPDGIIHILSNRLHYRFNLHWLEQPVGRR